MYDIKPLGKLSNLNKAVCSDGTRAHSSCIYRLIPGALKHLNPELRRFSPYTAKAPSLAP